MNNDKLREEQFLQVFLSNEDELKAYARALLPSWEVVDDVMQKTSLVIWRKMDDIREPGEFLPWAKVIVRFECLKARRTAARDRLYFSDEVYDLLASHDTDRNEDDRVRETAALEYCLAKLGTAQKELVLLLYRQHGAVASLADQSEKSVNSLYKKIRRIREMLTLCVSKQLGDPGIAGDS